jgi:anti-sigma regulatory factor (Ser/Thr protein kinase)
MPIPATTSATAAKLRGEPVAHAEVDLTGLDRPQEVARRVVRDVLADEDESWAEVITLVADELVGNADRHVETGKPIGIALDLYEWGAVVQVTDSGFDVTAVPLHPQAPSADEEGGRGLMLVNALASSWAVRPTDMGKCVVALFHHQPSGGRR